MHTAGHLSALAWTDDDMARYLARQVAKAEVKAGTVSVKKASPGHDTSALGGPVRRTLAHHQAVHRSGTTEESAT